MLRRNLLLGTLASAALPRSAYCFNERPQLYVQVWEAALLMRVRAVDGTRYEWDVSMGMDDHETPAGRFGVVKLDKNHKSSEYPKKWDRRLERYIKGGAPMPNSVFFTEACAIHGGSVDVDSHGCIHLEYDNSATLFELVRRYGKENTLIDIYPDVS